MTASEAFERLHFVRVETNALALRFQQSVAMIILTHKDSLQKSTSVKTEASDDDSRLARRSNLQTNDAEAPGW